MGDDRVGQKDVLVDALFDNLAALKREVWPKGTLKIKKDGVPQLLIQMRFPVGTDIIALEQVSLLAQADSIEEILIDLLDSQLLGLCSGISRVNDTQPVCLWSRNSHVIEIPEGEILPEWSAFACGQSFLGHFRNQVQCPVIQVWLSL
ncbi:MAG: hypothetical protein IPI28_01975 [Candidatus Omnitrophica bacterium]|nr:hypothetical protein [Candidatus Omnitrophota bacterium]